jgi:hypothetical protein
MVNEADDVINWMLQIHTPIDVAMFLGWQTHSTFQSASGYVSLLL